MRRCLILCVSLIILLITSIITDAAVYLFDDFEGFEPGESLDTSDIWEKHQNALGPGVASDELSYPEGGMSGYFEGKVGIRHTFSEGDLPDEFVISAWYYHDSSDDPADYRLVFRAADSPTDWIFVGTEPSIPNYTFMDKSGTGVYEDTGVERTDWVHIVWLVSASGTEILLNDISVHESTITGSQWGVEGAFIWFANVWSETGEAYLDSFVIADTLQDVERAIPMSVTMQGKLTTTWGEIKK